MNQNVQIRIIISGSKIKIHTENEWKNYYRMLDAGCRMLDAGCWMLDAGCWMLTYKISLKLKTL
jgi:hypothetical protein